MTCTMTSKKSSTTQAVCSIPSMARGRYPQGITGQRPAAERPRQRRGALTGSRDDHKLNQTRQLVRFAPLGQLRHMIGADQIKQRRTPKPVDIIADGINGEGNPSALQFLPVDLAIALAGQRQPQQAQSLFCRRRNRTRLEWRRSEEHTSEL